MLLHCTLEVSKTVVRQLAVLHLTVGSQIAAIPPVVGATTVQFQSLGSRVGLRSSLVLKLGSHFQTLRMPLLHHDDEQRTFLLDPKYHSNIFTMRHQPLKLTHIMVIIFVEFVLEASSKRHLTINKGTCKITVHE